MKITAKIESQKDHHIVNVDSGGPEKVLNIESSPTGYGSSVNGGEFLVLAIATCFCNDIYREAKKRGVSISKVAVEASGEFAKEGEPGYNLIYKARIEGDASEKELDNLIKETDKVAEIHNTLRQGVSVTLMKNN